MITLLSLIRHQEKFQKNLQYLIAIVDGQTNQEELAPVSEWMNEAMLMNNEEPTALMSWIDKYMQELHQQDIQHVFSSWINNVTCLQMMHLEETSKVLVLRVDDYGN